MKTSAPSWPPKTGLEDKFGYVYLVCASGRSAEELLAILTERLDNDPETETPRDA